MMTSKFPSSAESYSPDTTPCVVLVVDLMMERDHLNPDRQRLEDEPPRLRKNVRHGNVHNSNHHEIRDYVWDRKVFPYERVSLTQPSPACCLIDGPLKVRCEQGQASQLQRQIHRRPPCSRHRFIKDQVLRLRPKADQQRCRHHNLSCGFHNHIIAHLSRITKIGGVA